jgi:protein TonB
MAFAAESTMSPVRLATIIGIVALHILVIIALENGLARTAMNIITGPLDVKIIEEVTPDVEEPPPPPPKIETPPPFVPPPDFEITLPSEATTAITQTTSVVPPPAPPPMAAPVVKTPPRSPTKGLSRPDYPPTARRLNQEGTVVLMIYVLEDGRVGDVRVEKSSGYPKLDEAAANHAKLRWRFIPGMEGQNAVAAWGRFAVTFKLEEA